MNQNTVVEPVTEATHERARGLDRLNREQNAWRRFGTIGYEGYLAHVLRAEAVRAGTVAS